MKTLISVLIVSVMLSACAQTGTRNQVVLLGEGTIPGSQAAGEANVAIRNANAAGCNAISVGGYGLAGEGALSISLMQVRIDSIYGGLATCSPQNQGPAPSGET
jgi:hypothetical protein